MMVVEEEGVTADEGPAGAGEARPDRRMREPRAAEGSSIKAWSTDMSEVRAAHAADMHATEGASVHAATKASAVHPATEAATTTMTAAAETTAAMAAASTSASGEHGRSDRHDCRNRRRSETFEHPVVHRTILLAVRR
ncbi:hypothetical protein JJE66_04220 [Bradyrhizobium diazoefficiens]|nr:hypothetical protein [Bradyrhizobium diazoefficiens]